MKFLRNKYFLIGVLIAIALCIGGYLQYTNPHRFVGVKTILDKPGTANAGKNEISYNGKLFKVIKQKTFSENQYSSPQMNISFIYPANIKYKQITPQLVALYDPAVPNTDDNTLYIYSTTVPEDSISFKIPFTIPGNLKQTKIIKTQNYVANQETYSDGKNEITFLILRQRQQTIVIRIPPDSGYVSAAITDIMNSIQILH